MYQFLSNFQEIFLYMACVNLINKVLIRTIQKLFLDKHVLEAKAENQFLILLSLFAKQLCHCKHYMVCMDYFVI